jgi:hypothetical protein
MAIFNPDVPDVKPEESVNASKGISAPNLVSTAAGAIKDAGNILKSSVEVAHTLTKQSLDDKMYDQLTAIRAEEQANLDNIFQNVQGNVSGSASAEDKPPPAPVAQGIQRLNTLGNAAKAGGQLSQTHLLANYDAVLSDLRARYPGWREYIDRKSSQITGSDVANDLVRARRADINSYLTKAETGRNQIFTQLLAANKDGIKDADKVAMGFKAGIYSEEYALGFINKNYATKRAVEELELDAKARGLTQDALKFAAREGAVAETSQAVTNVIDTRMTAIRKDPEGFQQRLEQDGPRQQFANDLAIEQQKVQSELIGNLRQPRKHLGGKSYWDILGPEESNKIIKEQTSFYANWVDALNKKELTTAHVYETINSGIRQKDTTAFLGHNKVGPVLRALQVLKATGGDPAVVAASSLGDKLDASLQGAGTIESILAGTKTPLPDGRNPNIKNTLEGVERGVSYSNNPAFKKPETTAEFLNIADKILSPNLPPEIKKNYVDYFFGPDGMDWMNKIVRERQTLAFKDKLKPELAGAIKALGEDSFQKYKTWVETTFDQILFKPNVLELKNVQLPPNLTLTWDDQNHQFDVKQGNMSVLYSKNLNVLRPLRNINTDIKSFVNMAQHSGEDVNTYVLKRLTELSNTEGASDPLGIIERLRKSVTSTSKINAQQQKEQEQGAQE